MGGQAVEDPFGLARFVEAQAPVYAAALQRHRGRDIVDILGPVDALKYRSCLTLFSLAAPGEAPFAGALHAFYGGDPCARTLALLGR
jgi:Uncharacterized conserved protein